MRGRWPQIAAALSIALSCVAAGCGSEDEEGAPDAAALPAAFADRATEAYADQDLDRDRDFAQGVVGVDCFILDQQGAQALGEVVFGKSGARLTSDNFLQGPPAEEETLTCGLTSGSEATSERTGIVAGTTLVDAEGLRKRLTRTEGTRELIGEAPGLSADQVVAVEDAVSRQFAWVSEGFFIGLTGPASGLDPETGFEALAVAVAEVTRTLEAG